MKRIITPVLVVREMPGEVFIPPAASVSGIWQDDAGASLALLPDGSSCCLYLRRAPSGAVGFVYGRMLGNSLSAANLDKRLFCEGDFNPDGRLVLSVLTVQGDRGTSREVFVFRKAKSSEGGPTLLKLRY